MQNVPKNEHSSTYFVQDRSNEEEMLRLQIQDQILTQGMGGALPEQPDPARLQSILDIGCGTGGWLIETAKTYPTIKRLVGIDISQKMITYAREQAHEQEVDDRVEFSLMDTLRMLEFPNNSFDLINQRLGMSYLRMWDWSKVLSEYQRVGRRGAIIRVTESDSFHTNSPAFNRLNGIFMNALAQAGNFPSPHMDTMITILPAIFKRYGIQQVQTYYFKLVRSAGTPEENQFTDASKHLFRTLAPFFRKWAQVPENYDEIYQQMLSELQQPDFEGQWTLLTTWGVNAKKYQIGQEG